jgi:hypothetical protein
MLQGLQRQQGWHKRGQEQIVGTSYPSSSTGGAQHAALGGRGNSHEDSRCKNRPGGNLLRGKHNRSRASNFRKCTEYRREIELIDVDGNHTKVRTRGRMNVMQHDTVLQALTHRAQRFHRRLSVIPKDPQHSWTLDETGMLETSRLPLSSEIKTEQQEISELNSIQVPKEVLQVHGYAPPKKAEGTVCHIYENVNGFCN